jgi:diguanylate cyclase (GGDEF)-like protein/PAS domain S-box-containing protein
VTSDQGPSSIQAQPAENQAGGGLSDRLAFLLSENSFGVWDFDINTGGVEIDDRWAAMLGYKLEELTPMSYEKFASMVHPEDLEYTLSLVSAQIAGSEEPYDHIQRMWHKDGSWRSVRSRGKVTKFDDDGKPLLLTGINEDITESRLRDLELLVSRQQLETAQRIAGVGSWFLDLSSGEVTWSEGLYQMQGLDPAEPPPPASTHQQLFDEDSWTRLSQALAVTQTQGTPYELELRMERDGKFYGWMLARGEAVRDEAGEIVAIQGVALDITERKQTESRLQQRAAVDVLTGLGNRGLMNQRIEQALAAASRNESSVGCLMIDLDNFKLINDRYGHSVGDDVLREVAARLAITTRGSDAIFRPGGDEFVILLPGINDAQVIGEISSRIIRAFHEPIVIEGQEIPCTVSIGGAISDGSTGVSDLLRNSDTAMYSAKEQGRDRYTFFDDQYQLALVERLALETSMREGIGTDQFLVHYQPIWNLESRKIVGAEALLRWKRPNHPILDAKEFINVAEETGLLKKLGAFSLLEACIVGKPWIDAGLKRMHVNVSASQLSDSTFLDSLDEALTTSQMPPIALCLEVTEATLMRELSVVRSNLFGVHDRGVKIALDDFGTGYAALSHLNDLPIDGLKVDRSIVRSAARTESDARVLKGGLVLAQALELEFIAEGIETVDQLESLIDLGCELGQGHLLSHAISAEDFTKLLESE